MNDTKRLKMRNKFLQIITGFLAGLISGLFGTGGGLFLVPAYSFIFRQSEKEIKSNAIFCTLPMALISSIIYASHSSVNLEIVIKCVLGEVFGSLIGSKLLNSLKPVYIKIVYITFLTYASLKILLF